jgi:hypothetical protein
VKLLEGAERLEGRRKDEEEEDGRTVKKPTSLSISFFSAASSINQKDD